MQGIGKPARAGIGVAAIFLALLALACGDGQRGAGSPDASLDFPNILEHGGMPLGSEDWSFAPFSDQGAWFGFALAPAERSAEHGGFTGPLLLDRGRWVGPQLLRLIWSDEPATQVKVAEALPGRLRQTLTAPDIELAQELWFDSASTAIVRARLHNTGGVARSVSLSWAGAVFPDQAVLEADTSGIRVLCSDGVELSVVVDRAASVAAIDGASYTLHLSEPISLPPGGTASVAAAVVLRFESDAGAGPPDLSAGQLEASSSRNRQRWNEYLAAVDTGAEPQDPTRILAVKSLLTLVNNWRGPAGRLRYSGLFPSSAVHYFNGFWAWDSWKHAVALVRFDADLARDQVRSMFEHQDETGMVADVVYLDPKEDNWRDTKPPLSGWAVQEIHEASGDLAFVEEIYPRVVAYHRFWYADRDHDRDGLCEYGSTDGTIVAARWESGMDNAVRFDETEMRRNGERAWSMNQESVDLNSYLYREKLALEALSRALGRDDEASEWSDEARALRSRIQQEMFDEATGWFYDIDIDSGRFVRVQGAEGWIPLWSGVASDGQAARVREAMLDPDKFRTHVPFPTVARDDPGFSDGYWRGLVWLDQAYFALEGLRRYGYAADAADLERQLFRNLEGATIPGRPLRENYAPLTGEGRNVKHFSWTAAHLLLLALDGAKR